MTIYDEIKAERIRQDEKYGSDRDESPEYWLSAIYDEFMETSEAWKFDVPHPHDYRTEMIQLVTLGVAAIESWDKQNENRK